MFQTTLRTGLLLVVVAALLPIGALSLAQALTVLDYNRQVITNRLETNALATAGRENTPFILAEARMNVLIKNAEVRGVGPRCNAIMADELASNPSLINFLRIDASGQIRCSALLRKQPISVASMPWWEQAKNQPSLTLKAAVLGPVSRQSVILAIKPIAGPDGRFDGALVVSIGLKALQTMLADEKRSQTASVAIVDAAGRVILVNRPGQLPRFRPRVTDRSVAEVRSADDRLWLYATAPLFQDQLFVIYAEPRDNLMAVAIDQARVSLILPVSALLVTILGIWFGSYYLVIRWLVQLRGLAQQFSLGEYQNDPGSYARSPTEIAALSNELHAMGKAIQTRDRDLKSALEAKTALTHEVHHRVKNNLQIVSSLLSLQAATVTDPAAREALSQTRARIGALAQIHRMLYEEAFESDVIDFGRLLADLCGQLRSLHRHESTIELICNAQPQRLSVTMAVPLSLFAVEAVTNGFRHAFPDGRQGTITVNTSYLDGESTLQINDDGVGFNAAEEHSSMGHQLMAAFAQQLGGRFEIAPRSGGGSSIRLIYPSAGQ